MGAIYPDLGDGSAAVNNISGNLVVKTGSGRLVRVSVTTAGSAGGAVYDDTTTSPSSSNKIAAIPNSVGVVELKWPCVNGIVYTVGSGQVVSISYS